MLTIAIPTYNRNQTLRDNLALLLPQLNEQCRLTIYDNCSDVPVAETLRELLEQYPALQVQITRNEANIGANANIVRCIETCDTPWVWVLGDDDRPQPGAVQTILQHMDSHPDGVLLNFATDKNRSQTFVTQGLQELADKLDASADLPWISSSIYRAEEFRRHLKFGYQYLYSMLPHVVMLMHSIGENGKACFANRQIVEGNTRDAPPEQQWSLVNLALGYPVLLELPFAPPVREKLVEKLLVTARGDGFNLHFLTYQLLLMSTKHGESRTALYIYDQVCNRRYYFDKRPKPRLQRFLWRMLLRFPRAALFFYRLVKRQSLGGQGQQLQDRYGRL